MLQFSPISSCRKWFEVILQRISLQHNGEMQSQYNTYTLQNIIWSKVRSISNQGQIYWATQTLRAPMTPLPLHMYTMWFVIMCKKCWLCLCKPLNSCHMFGRNVGTKQKYIEHLFTWVNNRVNIFDLITTNHYIHTEMLIKLHHIFIKLVKLFGMLSFRFNVVFMTHPSRHIK